MSEAANDDLVLIQRSKEGDRAAFDSLIVRYEKKAYQYAYRLTSNQEEASDVVADAFVRVFRALPNFKANSTFGTWLYRIITNCYLDLRKKERSRSALSLDSVIPSDSGDVQIQIESTEPDPGHLTERSERERLVQGALEKMPDHQRAMLVMFHADGLSYEEIAEALDLPVGTVKSRMNRARNSIRELLSPDMELFQVD